jgi:manganese/zinc/iron transport system substrate-binding protein
VRGLRLWTAFLAVLFIVAGCGGSGEQQTAASGKLKITATTGMVAEIARRVGGDRVEVANLMGPGVDPHLYKASEGDIQRLTEADLIFYNGLNLEGKMGEIFVKMARRGKPTYAVTESVEPDSLREPPEFLGHYDPHIWFDVNLWSQAIATVVEAMSEADPASGDLFAANGAAYVEELKELHAYCRERIATIPKERRVLVTAHDAFGYFGRAYDIEVVGLQGISTAS